VAFSGGSGIAWSDAGLLESQEWRVDGQAVDAAHHQARMNFERADTPG